MQSHINQYYSKNMDKFGLITKNLDGGDTCSRHCTALYCMPHTAADLQLLLKYIPVNGIPRRHPDADKWYHRTNTTSRDQLIPYLCLISTPSTVAPQQIRQAFFSLFWQHAKKLFLFTWNTKRNFRYPTPEEHAIKSTPDVPYDYRDKTPDFCGPNIWAIYLRGLIAHTGFSWLKVAAYPILCILDLHKLADALLVTLSRVIGKDFGPTSASNTIDHDMQNSTLCIHYSAHNTPTPISQFTWKLYKPYGQRAAESFFQQAEEPRLDLAIHMLD